MIISKNKSKKVCGKKRKSFNFFIKEIDIYENLDFVSELSTKEIHEEEKKLFDKYHKLQDMGFDEKSDECLNVQKQILELNINGIVWLARKYYSGLIKAKKDEWEVINLVCIGVAESIPRYQDKGYTFLSFARFQIKHVINNYVHQDQGLSSYHSKGTLLIEQAENKFKEEYGEGQRPIHEYEEETGLTATAICKMDELRTISSTISMDMEGVAESINTVFESPEKELIKNEELKTLYNELNKLTPVQRDIINLYFGFETEKMNYKQIGRKLNMTALNVKKELEEVILSLRENPFIREMYVPKPNKKKRKKSKAVYDYSVEL